MQSLKYKVITSEEQYDKYCKMLEGLVFSKSKTISVMEEIDLLTLLIRTWDEEHTIFKELNPVEILKSLLKDHRLKSVDLANKLKVSPGLISDILNYKKGFSKDIIRRLAVLFKMSQEAFNRPYKMAAPANARPKASVKPTSKKKRSLAKLSDDTSFPEKLKKANTVVADLKWASPPYRPAK